MKRAEHKTATEYVAKHSIFAEVLTPELMADIGEHCWTTNGSQKYPELYCCILQPGRVDLSVVENGLAFVLEKAPKQPRTDLLANLRSTTTLGAVYELACFGCLVKEFGAAKLEPYPEISSGKRLDARLSSDDRHIFFEFTVLDFSCEVKRAQEYALRNGDGTFVVPIPGLGQGRLINKIKEKLTRGEPGSLNVLLLSQYSHLPSHDDAQVLIPDYLEKYGQIEPQRSYVLLQSELDKAS